MRNAISICLLWVLAILAYGQQPNIVIKKPAGKQEFTKSDLLRVKVKNRFVAAAQKIFDRTQDQEAKMVLGMVLENLVTITPVPEGMKFLEVGKPDLPWTAFLPLMQEDLSKPYLQNLTTNKNIFAEYRPNSKAIIVREFSPCSELWKGIMLLHEAHHAGDLIYQPYNWKNQQVFSEKERDVHNFQNRLVSQLGGMAYQQLLNKEIVRMRVELKKQGLDGLKRQPGAMTEIGLPSRTEYYPELDKVLTPALSQFEKDARQTSFWIHAVFTMYEQDRGQTPDAESGKAVFLHAVYSQGLFNQK